MIRQKGKNEESFFPNGKQLVMKVKEIIKAGNERRIIIKDKSRHVIASFPLTLGVVGAVLAPLLAAMGAIAALVTECSITVERKE